ncbi:hypothetical protein LguiA_033547 [Lonicera macranthoides]
MLAGGAAAAAAAYGGHHLTHGSGAGGVHYAQGAYGGHYGGVGHGHRKVKHGTNLVASTANLASIRSMASRSGSKTFYALKHTYNFTPMSNGQFLFL